MTRSKEEQATRNFSLGVSDRLSIINALMAQDRIEIRERQESVFKLTYYVVTGFIGIAAFSVSHPHLRNVLLLSQILLLLLYIVSFFTFRRWLAQARSYQQIRESFYARQDLLHSDPFEPIRKIEKKDRVSRFEDNALWFPFAMTVACALALFTYMFLHKA